MRAFAANFHADDGGDEARVERRDDCGAAHLARHVCTPAGATVRREQRARMERARGQLRHASGSGRSDQPRGGVEIRRELRPRHHLHRGNAHLAHWMAVSVGGVQMAHVAVDKDTGIIKMKKFVAVQDMGLVVNRKTAESQIYGAVIMGIAYSLFE